jgi:hypothetical protein
VQSRGLGTIGLRRLFRVRAHGEFKKADLDARQDLYRRLAEEIWNPDGLAREVES